MPLGASDRSGEPSHQYERLGSANYLDSVPWWSGTRLATFGAMLLARGEVEARAFGLAMARIASRYRSAELAVLSRGKTYEVVFRDGAIVAARSPHPEDHVARVALASGFITADCCALVEQVCLDSPSADPIEVCAVLGELAPEVALRVLRRSIVQCASRMVALEAGAFTVSAHLRAPVAEGTRVHVGCAVFLGSVAHVPAERLEHLVGQLGSRFELASTNVAELVYVGFGTAENPLVSALLEGVTFERLSQLPGIEPRRAYAAVYALVACGLATATQRLARGTREPPASEPITEPTLVVRSADATRQQSAAEAYERGEHALRAGRVDEAITDLARAAELVPQDRRYGTLLAWARFCGAHDKAAAGADARRALTRIASHDDAPVDAHYYLGVLERMLDRPARAEEHFRTVLERVPDHVEAATELRFLARSGR